MGADDTFAALFYEEIQAVVVAAFAKETCVAEWR
jgi:hypothetical protein